MNISEIVSKLQRRNARTGTFFNWNFYFMPSVLIRSGNRLGKHLDFTQWNTKSQQTFNVMSIFQTTYLCLEVQNKLVRN